MQEMLSISEIFTSIQGEGCHAGRPATIVRLAGCALSCRWCDTPSARDGGDPRTLDSVLRTVRASGLSTVLVTGGEPLLQTATPALCRRLADLGHRVLLETSGAYSIASIDPRVHRVVDLKCPDSGECARNDWENIALLGERDELKLVLASRDDYLWARRQIEQRRLGERCPVVLGVVREQLKATDLARWIINDRLDVRLQLQLHKILWPGRAGV